VKVSVGNLEGGAEGDRGLKGLRCWKEVALVFRYGTSR